MKLFLTIFFFFATSALSKTGHEMMQPLNAIDFTHSVTWSSEALANLAFKHVAEDNFLPWDHEGKKYLRRISWKYLEDGCYERAALAAQYLASLGFVPPAKLFLRGTIKLASEYALGGKAVWYFHVLNTFKIKNTSFVLDPASAGEAIELGAFFQKLAQESDLSKIEAAICGPGAIFPSDECDKTFLRDLTSAISSHHPFLDREWNRMSNLNMNAGEEIILKAR